MYSRLIIDGNAVYEIDEECMRKSGRQNMPKGAMVKQGECQERNKQNRNSLDGSSS